MARVIAFGAGLVVPAASVITVLIVMMSYAGSASPLVVLITFAASLCSALSIAEFARRIPSAGWSYTYNSRGLGRTAGFVTGSMMIFSYAMFVPAGIALSSAYASLLVAEAVHVTIAHWVLYAIILALVVLIALLGIRTSTSADLLLVAGKWLRSRRWPSRSWSSSGQGTSRPRLSPRHRYLTASSALSPTR